MSEPTPHAQWRNDVIATLQKQAKAAEKAASKQTDETGADPRTVTTSKTRKD